MTKRIKSLESQISEIKDNYEEMDNNLEDIYDTINDSGNDSRNDSGNDSRNDSGNDSRNDSGNDSRNDSGNYSRTVSRIKSISNTNYNLTNEKQFTKYISNYIDHIIKSRSKDGKDGKNSKDVKATKTKCINFYNKLIQNQPQLHEGNGNGNASVSASASLKEHITYFIEQDNLGRDTILNNLEKVYEVTDNKTPRFFKIINSNLDPYHKKIALNKLHILETMQKTDSEYFKISQWLDTFIDIPFNIYKTPSYMDHNITNNPAKYLLDSRTHLDTVIYGQNKTKQHIIEIIAKMIRNPKTLGSVFAIYGEPGTGKTTLIKDGLSHIFGLPFIFISLGGAQDRSTLAGSNYVYEGSACGKIIQSLKQSKCMNPIFYFDELDKISSTDRGNEIINLLIHLTDYTQNSHFMDDYMDGIAINLSRATFIFSFNDNNKISPILLDRMEIIKFNSYSICEKMVIAREFLLPNIVKNVFNDVNKKVIISDENMLKIIKGEYVKYSEIGFYDGIKNCEGFCKGGYCGSFCKGCYSKRGSRYSVGKLGKLGKNILKKKKNVFCNGNYNGNGGVRYIKKNLENIVSRINMEDLQNTGKS